MPTRAAPAVEEVQPNAVRAAISDFVQTRSPEAFRALDRLPGLPPIEPDGQAWLQAVIAGCEVAGNPVADQDKEALRTFTDAIERTRGKMRWGRGNLDVDVERSAGYSCFLAVAEKRLRQELEHVSLSDVLHGIDNRVVREDIDKAALHASVGVGYCDEYVLVLMAEMLPSLQSGDAIERVIGDGHASVVWHREGRPPLHGDAWGYGPASPAQCSSNAGAEAWPPRWTHEQAADLWQRYRAKQQELREVVRDRLPALVIGQVRMGVGAALKSSHWKPRSAISPSFAKQVGEVSADDHHPGGDAGASPSLSNLAWVPTTWDETSSTGADPTTQASSAPPRRLLSVAP